MLRSIGCKLALGLAGVALASASAAADNYMGRRGYYGYAPPANYGYAPPRAYGYAPPGAYGYAPGAYGYAPPGAYGNALLPAYGYGPAYYNYYTYPADRPPPSNPYYFGTGAWWQEQELIGHN